jgi:hypothetical protein
MPVIYIEGVLCSQTRARKAGTCAWSGKRIVRGDLIYKPMADPKDERRDKRWLASEVEKMTAWNL